MIVTDWAAAREAIVEQRGERLAADIEALLRERELLAEDAGIKELEGRLKNEIAAHGHDLAQAEASIKELEARVVAAVNQAEAWEKAAAEEEARAQKAEDRIKDLEAERTAALDVALGERLEQHKLKARLEAVKALLRRAEPLLMEPEQHQGIRKARILAADIRAALAAAEGKP